MSGGRVGLNLLVIDGVPEGILRRQEATLYLEYILSTGPNLHQVLMNYVKCIFMSLLFKLKTSIELELENLKHENVLNDHTTMIYFEQ